MNGRLPLRSRVMRGKRSRRGVASVLAMMFLILFGSLATAMAIASRGNIKTAATHLHVSRALGAAETGLRVAQARLDEAAARFVISESSIDKDYGALMWSGGGLGPSDPAVLPPRSGFSESQSPQGIAQAIANAHAADQNIVTGTGVDVPTIGNAKLGADLEVYAATNWVYTPAVAIDAPQSQGGKPLAFSVIYAPLANGTDVRVIVTGYDFDYSKSGQPITRTIMQDVRMVKRVNSAINSPARIMIGKNVLVSGDLGARYSDVSQTNGDPLVMRSDFYGLDSTLDKKLTDFFNALASADIDGDNRLRVGHPTEGAAIPSNTKDYDGDGKADNAFADVTGDGYVDEFDIFINHFDKNHDGKVVLSAALTDGTPNDGVTPELVDSSGDAIDDDLALLLDSAKPDRNRNGVYGFVDTNRDGVWNAGEPFLDVDPETGANRDQVLGYRDGAIDKKDQYAKVRGRLVFKVSEASWKAAQGNYQPKLRGAIEPSSSLGSSAKAPKTFSASTDELPELTAASFSSTDSALKSAANGGSFAQQVADNLGVSVGQLATYVETKSVGTQPRYFRVDPDANLDGLPDNWQTAYFEMMPYNSPSASDYYYRPVYENMTFRDVVIPEGNNGLFRNCTFIGVTYVKTHTSNSHVLWAEYGKMKLDTGTGRPGPKYPRVIYGDESSETSYPTMLPSSAVPPNQMILMSLATPLDKADIPADQVSSTQGYDALPAPLVINGKRIVDTKAVSNNLRFHDCLFVGSIISDTPSVFIQSRNKLQFTGSTRFTQKHPDYPDDSQFNPQSQDVKEIEKSSMMAPNYSVDIGSFNSPPTQDVNLKGAIIAGVMDMRGNATLDGALLLTFAPVVGQAPLVDSCGNAYGNPAGFNTTIGYFGPDDGDAESLDPAKLPTVNGQKIVGWDTNGDGLADVAPDQPQPSGSTAVPFYGYGRIQLRFDPNMVLPDGILLPLQFDRLYSTYKEGRW